jgi:threonine/homoserine/homoserine lactone efflux protein
MSFWQALGVGIGLGLGAGITPGPLLGLVIRETLRGGWRPGVLVALAPLIADVFIIAFCFLFLVRLPTVAFSLLSLVGGVYVMFLGWETLRMPIAPETTLISDASSAQYSLLKGIAVNLLNPHPYLFWVTVGGPLVTQSFRQSAEMAIVAFLAGFYGCLVGSKVLLALLVHGGRTRLQGKGYRLALRTSGGFLLLFGFLLLWGGILELW